jgi:hypothetical protein
MKKKTLVTTRSDPVRWKSIVLYPLTLVNMQSISLYNHKYPPPPYLYESCTPLLTAFVRFIQFIGKNPHVLVLEDTEKMK